MDFTIAKMKVIVAFFAWFFAGFWVKTLRDVPQCWLLWQKVVWKNSLQHEFFLTQ